MLDRYAHKIREAADLVTLVPGARRKKIVMCHGVFDIVHPGHIRHLLYAKDKGDVLVCSITSDRYVSKGRGRPHVPQELRAANLAALECVDFVVVDDHEEPIELIHTIKPNVFAKGFEYDAKDAPATDREREAVRQHGGELIFTPGDVVYSSTKILASATPSLHAAKLEMVMQRFGISFDGLRKLVDAFRGKRVHVLGDLIVDVRCHCTLLFGQPKAPMIGAAFDHEERYIGGAGVVARHLAGAGAEAHLTTVVGNDGANVPEVQLRAIVDGTRPTTEKRVFLVDGRPVFKVDRLDNRAIGDDIVAKLAADLASARDADAIVLADFRHGIFNERTTDRLIAAIPQGPILAADSQVASRWGNILDFKDFDLITPNEREARFALADQDSGIRPLASRLYDEARCKTLILKLGERGVLGCFGKDHDLLDSFVVLDSFAESAVDPVGAGDALLAYATLALCSGGKPAEATILGSMAAGAKVCREGNVAVTSADMHGMIDKAEEMLR